ncbi:MAG: hypothetical protein HKN12_09130 [Gemmatimonadetes bacterium]|nr:hypothetical protein [Gemmatimonadota bacterium]
MASEPTPRRARGSRIFIGDVHGCADELEHLLDKLQPDLERDELWFVGDIVNRGPASLRALRRVREVAAGVVLGNHDLHLLGVAAGERETRRRDTLDDVLAADDRDDLIGWLRTRPLIAEWEDRVLVHAGLHPEWSDLAAVARPLEAAIAGGRVPWMDADLSLVTRVRHCDADGRLPRNDEEPGPGFAPWDEHYRGVRPVVCGHWAARGVVVTDRVLSLDSGCVWGGRLTAWVEAEDRLVSVPARHVYQTP